MGTKNSCRYSISNFNFGVCFLISIRKVSLVHPLAESGQVAGTFSRQLRVHADHFVRASGNYQRYSVIQFSEAWIIPMVVECFQKCSNRYRCRCRGRGRYRYICGYGLHSKYAREMWGKKVLGELQRFTDTLCARWAGTQVSIDNIDSFQLRTLRTLRMDSIIHLGIAILQYFGMWN